MPYTLTLADLQRAFEWLNYEVSVGHICAEGFEYPLDIYKLHEYERNPITYASDCCTSYCKIQQHKAVQSSSDKSEELNVTSGFPSAQSESSQSTPAKTARRPRRKNPGQSS